MGLITMDNMFLFTLILAVILFTDEIIILILNKEKH